MSGLLSVEELEELRRLPTPAIANAIELFEIRPRNEGFMSGEILCRFPDLGSMIGYAATGVITAASPEGRRASIPDYWDYVLGLPGPRVSVLHDVDDPVVGSQWGEVQANIHRALGCVGAVTDGTVRDLDEAHALGFHFFSRQVGVSHAYVHIVEFGLPVTVGGLVVNSGDLLVGDRHGIVQVPPEIARDVPRAARLVESWERRVIDACRSEDRSLAGMQAAYLSPRPAWPGE
jgi:4-hydroxy-4-methyl-2-oxoglutarate aldolase